MSAPLIRTCGPVPTLWDGDGPKRAWREADDLLLRARPKTIQIHAWEPRPVIDDVREAFGNPDLGLIVGVGVDGVAKKVATRVWSEDRAVKCFLELARIAVDAGAFALKINAEGGWKRPPTSDEAKRLRSFIKRALREIHETYPDLVLLFTSYDHPAHHSEFPWEPWLGEDSPILEVYMQIYAAGLGKEAYPHRGALPARERRAFASYKTAVRKKLLRPDVPDGQPGDESDLDFRPYLQLHHVHATDTIAMATRFPTSALWAVQSRSDSHGRAALLVLCELFNRGFWGEFAVRDFQRSAGIADDNVCGRITAEKLGLADVWPVKPPTPLVLAA